MEGVLYNFGIIIAELFCGNVVLNHTWPIDEMCRVYYDIRQAFSDHVINWQCNFTLHSQKKLYSRVDCNME